VIISSHQLEWLLLRSEADTLLLFLLLLRHLEFKLNPVLFILELSCFPELFILNRRAGVRNFFFIVGNIKLDFWLVLGFLFPSRLLLLNFFLTLARLGKLIIVTFLLLSCVDNFFLGNRR